jgi:hypothetical protein
MKTTQRQRLQRIAILIAMGLLAYLLAAASRDFWRVDACLDSGGSWDRRAESCVRDGVTSTVPAAYPSWVFLAFGTISVVILMNACVSAVATFMRRWADARRLGGWSFLAGIGVFVVTMVLATIPSTLGVPGPESKAMRLAKTISEFMNSTAGIYPAVVIGGTAWIAGALGQWRRTHNPG